MPTNLETLLENLLSNLEEDIDEAAVAISQARTEKLALAVVKGRQYGRVSVVLYKPDFILKNMACIGKDSINLQRFKHLDEVNVVADAIVGYLSFEDYSKGFKVISLSMADRGYGPMLYDIALSLLYPESLMSDRHSVSESAQQVWSYYFSNRADVIHKPVPLMKKGDTFVYVPELSGEMKKLLNRLEIITPPEKDGVSKQKYEQLLQKYKDGTVNNPLSYAYKIKSPKSFASLLNNHQKFIRDIKSFGVSEKDISSELTWSGSRIANSKIE